MLMKPRSLTSVVKSYKRWKASNVGHRAPTRLKKEVVGLLGRHTIKTISSRISISPGTIARWRDSYNKAVPPKKNKPSRVSKAAFVEVVDDFPKTTSRSKSKPSTIQNVTVELSKPSGDKMSFVCDLTPEVAAALASGFFQDQK